MNRRDAFFDQLIGLRLKFLRVAAGKTMRDIHSAGGPTPAFQSDVERGKRSMTIRMLCKWCKATGEKPENVVSVAKELT